MVEIFRTNVNCLQQASYLVIALQQLHPHTTANFDLEDCDHILRIKADHINCSSIAACLHQYGYECELLN